MKKVKLILFQSLASWALAMNQLFNNQILNLHFLLNKRILKILNFKLKIIVETWYHKFTKVIHNHHQHSGSNLVYSNLLLKASKAIPRSLNGNVKSFPGQYFDGCNFMSCNHTNFAVWKDILLAFRFLTWNKINTEWDIIVPVALFSLLEAPLIFRLAASV